MSKFKNFYGPLYLSIGTMVLCFTLPPSGALAESLDVITTIANISANISPTPYSVSSVTGSSQVIESDQELGFPTSKLYTFKLCLTHPSEATPLKDTTIAIDGTSAPVKPQKLDDSCFSWLETINYHFTARARYVTQVRTISLHRQSKTTSIPFRFAINPWLHGESSTQSEIADFIKIKPRNPVPPMQATETFAGKNKVGGEVSLIANDSRVNFQELGIDSKLGGKFLFDFRTNPLIEVYNLAGQPVYLKMNQGQFEFEAYLLSTLFEGESQVRRIVNPSPIRGTALLQDGALAFQQEVILPAVPSRGRLELAVVLKVKQQRNYLRVFKGIYLLGNYTDLKSNLFARIKTGYTNANKGFEFEEYVGLKAAAEKISPETPKKGFRRLKYEFEPLLFRLTRIGEETATSRKVFYQVRACVRNGTDNTPLRAYPFTITKANPNTSTPAEPTVRTSEYDSCIYWDDRIDHKFYAPQKYFRAEYRIENKELNLDETLVAYINPWEMILSRDARTIEPEELQRQDGNPKLGAQLFIPNFQIQTRTINYDVDPILNLTIKKQVHLLIEPKVINYTNLSRGIDARDPIRDGIWKIKWAILHNRHENNTNSFKTITRGELLTIATQGRIVAPLTLTFNDFRFINSRNYLMLEIAPVKAESVTYDEQSGIRPKNQADDFASTIDWESGLSPQTFIGPIFTNNDFDTNYLIPHPTNATLSAFLPSLQNDNIQTSKPSQNDLLVFEQGAPSWDSLSSATMFENTPSRDTLAEWQKNIYIKGNQVRSWNLNSGTDLKALRRALGPSAYSIKYLSENYQRDLFATEILSRALNRQEFTAELEDRLCFYFFDQNPEQPLNVNHSFLPWRRSDKWLRRCLQSVGQREKSFFKAQIETFLDTVTGTEFIGSTSSNLSVNAGFNISSSESLNSSSSLSASTQLGLSVKISDLFSIGTSTSYSLSRSKSRSQSSSNSLAISSGVSLNVRKLTLKINGTFSQQCLTVALNPLRANSAGDELWNDLLKIAKTEQPVRQFVNQRVRLCINLEVSKTYNGVENFYFVLQDNSNVGFIDGPDLRNRPLLLQLRGENAFENFLQFAASGLNFPEETGTANTSNFSTDDHTQRSMRMPIPSFPGLLVESI